MKLLPAAGRRLGVAGLLLASIAVVHAQTVPVDRQARVWAASCAACHGTDGRSLGGGMAVLAGRSADDLYRALIELRADKRPAATVMHQHAKGYTEEELRRIAAYFAAQRPEGDKR